MQDMKMPLQTLGKETSKHLYQVEVSGRAARLTSYF